MDLIFTLSFRMEAGDYFNNPVPHDIYWMYRVNIHCPHVMDHPVKYIDIHITKEKEQLVHANCEKCHEFFLNVVKKR